MRLINSKCPLDTVRLIRERESLEEIDTVGLMDNTNQYTCTHVCIIISM